MVSILQHEIEPTIYQLISARNTIYVGVYVDDLLVVSKHEQGCKDFVKILQRRFSVKVSPSP